MAVFIELWSTSIELEFGVLLPETGGSSCSSILWVFLDKEDEDMDVENEDSEDDEMEDEKP